MTYTTGLDNIEPATQMPFTQMRSSGEDLAGLEPVDADTVQQPSSSMDNHACHEIEETVPAIQMPSSEADQAGVEQARTYPDVSLPSPEDNDGAFPAAGIEDVSRELKSNGLTDQQISRIIEGLVKSSPFRNSVVNKAHDMFSLPRSTPSPAPHLGSRANDIAKDKLFTTPSPKQVKTPGAPRPTRPINTPPAPRMRKAPSSKPVPDFPVHLGNIETNIQDLKAAFQLFTQQHRPPPFPVFTQQLKPQPPSTLTYQPQAPPSLLPTPATSSSCLLSLPAELRTLIYRYAITGPRTLEIDKARWSTHQPPLLRTCTQIRAEALRLFYIENKISTNIHDWNPIVKYRFQLLMVKYRIPLHSLHHYFSGTPNWQNLLLWLRAVHMGLIGAISDAVGKQRPLERKIVGVMFKVVRKATGVSTWSQVEDLLVAHRELLGMVDARWMPGDEDKVAAGAGAGVAGAATAATAAAVATATAQGTSQP